MATDVVSLDAVQFAWPGQHLPLLSVQHFTMRSGDQVLLRGPSGAGKSTLLSLIAGLLPATSGRAQLMGTDWSSLSPSNRDRWRADHIGIIFQTLNLIPFLSVRHNILLPCTVSPHRRAETGQNNRERDLRALELMDTLGLGQELADRPAHILSVGQQQRVAAARALIGQPALIIADEPTSALDPGSRDQFLSVLRRQCEKDETALLIVSHDPAVETHVPTVIAFADLNSASTALPV